MLSSNSSDITSNWSQTSTTERYRQMQYFKETLSDSGVILISGTSPNMLSQETALVIRDLEKILEKDATYPRNIERFTAGLKRFCSDDEDFKKALMTTKLHQTSGSGDLFFNSESVTEQGSVFRVLLNVDCLQKQVLDLLFDYLVKYAIEENDEVWVPLLLRGLRHFPYFKEPTVVCKKLMDVLDVATYPSQLEILNLLPDIIPNMQHDEIAKKLGVFLDENSELAGAVVSCLNLLQISPQTKADIQDRILAKLLCENCFKIFPILYDFLVNNANTQDLQAIFIKIRGMLDSILGRADDNNEMETNKTALLAKLYTSAVSSKVVYNTWLTLLSNIRNSNDHKPIDILLLFLLHSTTETRRHNTEMLFKKKIKTGQLKTPLLETFFKNITPQFLKDHFETFLKIASYLLQNSRDCMAMRDFASTLYRETFLCKKTDCFQHQDVIHNLLLATTRADQETVSAALKVFTELVERDFLEVQKHALQIMALLENLDVFELKEVKDVFEILCRLTCGEKADDNSGGLKDEIHMIVRKQLQRPDRVIKHKGIVAAVVMAKHVATTSSEQSDVSIDEDSTVSMADLPDARSKEAAGLIDLTNISSESSPESMGLFYDELASMLTTNENLDKYFLAWLKDTITNDFQNTFIADNISASINDIPLTVQYSLNSDDEINEPICVNIAEVTLKSQTNQILTLSPMFRLLRLLHFRQYSGDLGTIDALLGCGVAMPTITDNMDSDQIKQAADCVFHCTNWFRENISAFVSQKSRLLRKKVVERLKNLLELERILHELMLQVPEHKLPGASKKQKAEVKKGKKSPKSKEIINETTTSIATQATKSSSSTSKRKSNEIEISFREMDTDIMVLLKHPVKINDETVSQSSQKDIQLDLKQFCYVLKDVIVKLEVLVQGKRVGLSPLNAIKSSSIIKDLQLLLPNISRTLNKISMLLKQTLDKNDSRYDLPDLFSEEVEELKNTFGLTLHCITLIFSWNGFQDTKNLNLLRDCLKALRDDTSSQLNSTNRQTLDFASKLYNNHIPVCMHITHAVELVKIMQVFHAITESNDLKKMIIAAAGKFLKRKWYNSSGMSESGKQYNFNLGMLLKAYLNGADVKTISGLIGTLQKQAPDLESKEDCLHMLGSIDKPALPVLFQALCNALLERVRNQLTSLTNREHLTLWKTTGLSLQGLMTVVKIHETRVNLVCFFKKSIGILKLFLNQGIPILEIMLKTKPDEVVDIFKTMQSTTRFLHHLCCHSKLTRDTSVITYVPQFRLTLETLVYRVKAALVANNCSDAFWMGNLRNRDLHGEDILTQESTSTENDNEEEEDDDALPEDEDSDEEIILGEERSSTSASEVI